MLNFNKHKEKMHSDDRVLVLKPISGNAANSTGMIDARLFKGTNNLHALKDPYGMWAMAYDSGVLPQPLKQKFTSFNGLHRYVTKYFGKRGVNVVEVKDHYG